VGGTAGASGAATSGNGSNQTGGSIASGGSNATAGTSGSAGAVATGGTPGTGGQAGAGGSSSAGGGNAGMGGSAGTGGAGGSAGGGPATEPCAPARPRASGNSTVTLTSGGMNRTYLLHIPPGYDGTKPLPLVFDIHGYTSFASEQMMRSKWDKMADKEGFVLIEPEGVNKSWNAGSCCGGAADDVKYFRDVVAKATADLCIDKKRIYVTGHSNGGAMTHRLACEAADIFAAAAPVCGWMTINNCNPVRPVPVLSIRGLNDGTVKIDTADGDINEWLSNDECAKDQVTTSGVCKTYKSCKAGTQVMDCRPRGGHDFFYANNPDNYLVPENAWPFFKQFSLP
jgi:polyhydroxybutyrate depolymerase